LFGGQKRRHRLRRTILADEIGNRRCLTTHEYRGGKRDDHDAAVEHSKRQKIVSVAQRKRCEHRKPHEVRADH